MFPIETGCLAVVCLLAWISFCLGSPYQETKTQVCYGDVFNARCPYTKQILITQAMYGHIEVSKCVSEKFALLGEFGCYADAKAILDARCSGKQRCEITMPDAEVIATKTCSTGLPMYLDVSYVCIPATIANMRCEEIRVDKMVQYLTSQQILKGSCVNDQDSVSKQATIKAADNMKIKFTFGLVKPPPLSLNTTQPYAYIVDGSYGTTAVMLHGHEAAESTTHSNTVQLIMAADLATAIIVSFQEVGCADLSPPPHTWVTRKGDITTIGCQNSDFTWQLKCDASNWIGSTGNCTNQAKVVVNPEPANKEPPVTTVGHEKAVSKEILFALIIGVTVFLCAVVITAGFVCLKRAKYKTQAVGKNSVEMNTILFDGEGTTSWTRRRSMNGQPTVNNQWQQTIKSQGAPANQKYYILDREDINTLRP